MSKRAAFDPLDVEAIERNPYPPPNDTVLTEVAERWAIRTGRAVRCGSDRNGTGLRSALPLAF